MAPKDDILDAFDDEKLKSSIDSANTGGEWRDDTKFVEPRLMALAEQLANPPRPTDNERRFAELARRAAKKDKAGATREPAKPAAPPAIEPAAHPPARPKWEHARTVAMAFVVFALAAGVQCLVVHPSLDLWLRSGIAAAGSGAAWVLLGAGRFRAAGLGGAAHLAAFLTTTDFGNRTQMTAVFLGLFVVLLGSGAAGLVQEESRKPLG